MAAVEYQFDMRRLLNHKNLWPCVLKKILSNMTNKEVENFKRTCKDASDAIEKFRKGIEGPIRFIKNGCGFEAMPNRMYCKVEIRL